MTAVYQASRNKETHVIGNPANNPSKLRFDYDEKDQGGGVLAPLGGAAVGLDGAFSSGDLKATTDQRNSESVETLRERRGQMHFAVAFTNDTRAAFAYRYTYIERDVLGSFNLRRGENTTYKGSFSGYKLGLFHQQPAFGVGVYNAPAMRGKASVEGEQKILAAPGVVGVAGYVNGSLLRFGLGAQQFYYKKDDRRRRSTSEITQRQISLNGLDLDQYFFKTRRLMAGFDFNAQKQVALRGTVYRVTGVWLFDPDELPEKEKEKQQTMTYNGGRLALCFTTDGVRFELGLEKETRSASAIRDSQGSLGFGGYGSYEVTSDTAFVDLVFLQ